MSLVTLLDREGGWLATDQRVFASDTVEGTLGCLKLGDRLSTLIERRQAVIEEAREEARREGFEAGFAQGAEEARVMGSQATAETLSTLERDYAVTEERFRRQVSQLALDVVRKVAGAIAPADWLHAQASTAAADLLDTSRLVLRVHTSQVDAVRAVWRAAPDSLISDVQGDDTVHDDACIVETPRGSIDVDLATQLQRIGQLLDDRP